MSVQGTKNVLIIELNEFNVELLTAACQQHSLPSIAKILALPSSSYKTHDRYNSGYLEPWVQWVSIHTGQASRWHQIKHLGEVPQLQQEQCWEVLSKHNITTGVWGVMNGARRNAHNNLFFLPDPWTFSEWGTPAKLNALLDLPRFLSKNYQNLKKSFFKIAVKSVQLLKFVATSGIASKIIRQGVQLLKDLRQHGYHHYIFISHFDYVSTLLFTQYKKHYQPRCAFLFLNSIAHLQHHYWREGTAGVTPQILFGLQKMDQTLALLFTEFLDDAVVVHNGLSQMNTNHEKPWVLYRQKDPLPFLRALGIPAIKVEQHMTHDGHVFFNTAADCTQAQLLLKQARLQNKPLFHVESNKEDPRKLFYQLKFTDELDPNTPVLFDFNQKQYKFFDYFDRIVTRTGRHIPIGTVYSDTLFFPDQIYNHDFNRYLYHYLLPETFKLREDIEEELFSEEDLFA
jgi:hypothetical protein